MDPLQRHVQILFRKYNRDASKQIKDLKHEVLSNLEAKVADLTASGMDRHKAIAQATASIPSVEHLIDDNRSVYINRYVVEFAQIALLYLLIAWIVSMPLQVIGAGIGINLLLFGLCLFVGTVYVILLVLQRKLEFREKTGFLNLRFAYDLRKKGWWLWIVFMLVSYLYTTAIRFGSNLWFWREVKITGPYQLAELLIPYALPFLTLLVPLLLHTAPRLIMKHEVNEDEWT